MSKFVFFLTLLAAAATSAQANEIFEVRPNDRIALVGDTLIERAQESGWLETEMAADFSDRRFMVRNLGWSADTPAGKSRASFDFADPKKTFELLATQIAQVKPTVVFLGYGMASSFSGPAGLEPFKSEMNRLIDTIQAQATNQVRFVILGPLRHYELPPPLPNPAAHNAALSIYTEALRQIASKRGFPFVDLYDWKPPLRGRDLTDDGIHLTADGYRCMAAEVARQLGWPENLRKAGKKIVAALRQTVIHKDHLFFDRWRPQNETYLFGFRKHEQGQNAHEIPEFDPLVNAQDDEIARFQQLIRAGKKSVPTLPPPAVPVHQLVSQPLPDFTVAPGFEVSLWAEDPLLAKPIQMNFDPQGRLWVASSAVYPQIEPGQTADDKIVVLEDTKGLGHANKSTVFADGLFIPQGVEPGDGGCYVGQSTELLHFRGTLGHGKPVRRVVLSGFGTEDTHHMVHTLKWGPDGMLYFNQSIYIHSHLETPRGVVRLNSGGVFHLRPSTMQLDVFLRGFCNPWGHQFDPFGQSFITDGAGWQGISWGVRDATYFTYAESRREFQSISPGTYPKFCGLEIVESQQFPDDWQGNFITSDFRAHRVVRFSISDDGAGYVTKEMPELLTSTNVTFRPVDAKFGPDGALYIADWANPIINHGEVDFRDPRRDHEHGRIWRVAAKGRPLLPRRDLARLSNEKLFAELLSSNLYEVEQSRRVLAERGSNIQKDLDKWTARQTDPEALLQSVWVHQSIRQRDDALLNKILQAPNGRMRAAAVRVLSFWPRTHLAESGPDQGRAVPDDCYARALADPFPRARVEALRAVALVPSLRSAALALDTLNRPTDPFLDYALWLTINDLASPWLAGIRSGAWPLEGHDKELEFGLGALEPELARTALTEEQKRRLLRRNGAGPWIEWLGRTGAPADADLLYRLMLGDAFDSAAMTRAAAALVGAANKGVKPPSDLGQVVKFLTAPDQKLRLAAIRLAGSWSGPGDSFAQLNGMAGSPETAPAVRAAAIDALKKIGGARTVAALQPLARPGEPGEVRQAAVLALAGLDPAHCGSNAVAFLSGQTSETNALAVWRALLGNAGVGPAVAAALPARGFPGAAGKAGLRAVRESGQNEPELIMALARAAGLQGAETVLTTAGLKKLGEAALKEGDPARGELIFRRPQQSCATCHSIGGVGGKVGPDLTSVGASSPVDYLVESVLYPNKQIKDGYQSCQIETTDGEEVSGIPLRENATEIVLRTAGDQDVTVAKKQIRKRKAGGSLMPAGLVDGLSRQEQLDLYRFLSELGKPGPFDASKGNVARWWAVSSVPPQASEEQKLLASPLTGAPWHRAASLVDGRLPGSFLPTGPVLAGTRFRSVKAGQVQFEVSAPAGTEAWVDGKALPGDKSISADLPAGTHTVIFKLAGGAKAGDLRVASNDGTFLNN